MIHVLLDTSVLMDFLLERKPYEREAEAMMEMAHENAITLHCTSTSFTNLHSTLSTLKGGQKASLALKDLLELIHLVPIDQRLVCKALNNDHTNLESALQLEAALAIKSLYGMVTANPKYFKTKDVLIQTPKEFIDAYNQLLHE